MASVVLEGVAKRFESVEVLQPIDLEVEDGEFLILLGPSGCGKSTTLRMVAGLETPSAGRIFIGGRDVTSASPKDRDVAMVFQSYALYPHLSVRRNLEFGLKMRRLPKKEIEERVEDAAAMLGIRDLLDRTPKELSGGQRQRVAMGRAIVRRPSVFLFDEPLSNLDASLRSQMRAEIAGLHRRLGVTTVYVTHDQIEAMTLGSRLVVMHGGRVQQIGAPLEVYANPANGFVGGFLGAPSMNLVRGRVTEGPVFRSPDFELALPAAAKGVVGREVFAGFRPQSLERREGGPVAGAVRIVESMGSECFVRFDAGCAEITARVRGHVEVEIGHPVFFGVAPDAIHLFEVDSDGRAGSAVLSRSLCRAA